MHNPIVHQQRQVANKRDTVGYPGGHMPVQGMALQAMLVSRSCQHPHAWSTVCRGHLAPANRHRSHVPPYADGKRSLHSTTLASPSGYGYNHQAEQVTG